MINELKDSCVPTRGHITIYSIQNGIRSVVYDKSNTIMVNAKKVLAMALMRGADDPNSEGVFNSRITKLEISNAAVDGGILNWLDTDMGGTNIELIEYDKFGSGGDDWTVDPWKVTQAAVLAAHDGYAAELLSTTESPVHVDRVRFTFAVKQNLANGSGTEYYNAFGMKTTDGDLIAGQWLTGNGTMTSFSSVTSDASKAVFNVATGEGVNFSIGNKFTVTGSTPIDYDGEYTVADVTGDAITVSESGTFAGTAIGIVQVTNKVINVIKDNTRAIEVVWTIQF